MRNPLKPLKEIEAKYDKDMLKLLISQITMCQRSEIQ